MIDDASIRRQLLAAFLGELEEHVRTLTVGLLDLETDPGTDIHRMLRAAHSLKGASAALRLRPLERLCHWLEDRLSAARDGLVPAPEEFADLFAAVDAMQTAGQRLAAGEDLGDDALVPWLAVGADALEAAALEEQMMRLDLESMEVPVGVAHVGVAHAEAAPLQPQLEPARPSEPSRPVELPTSLPEASFLRVAVSRLDALYSGSGELVRAGRRVQQSAYELRDVTDEVAQWQIAWRAVDAWISRAAADAPAVSKALLRTLQEGSHHLRDIRQALEGLSKRMLTDDLLMQGAVGRLQSLIAGVRLQPFGEICHGLDRAVRDVARSRGKDVVLRIEGAEVELDRSILSALRDPLLHLVRNAVDHGVEAPAVRVAAGKSPSAEVLVSARIVGSRVEVTVADNGRGLNVAAIRARARERGLIEPAADDEAIRLIFRPGFSTAAVVTDVSGRGVGLDVVKSQIEALNGTVEVTSEVDMGTRFVMRSPLTLTSLRALRVRLGGQEYAVPSTSVDRALRIGQDEVKMIADRPMLMHEGHVIPMVYLGSVLTPGVTPPVMQDQAFGLLLGTPPRQVLFIVDDLLSEQEITMQGLGSRIGTPPHFSGASVLADGRVLLILNAASLLASVLEREHPQDVQVRLEPQVRRRLLVVDDSITVRTLEKSLLESAGYDVVAAVDGLDAWEKLQAGGIDLVVADVEMPRADGLQFVRMVRESEQWRDLPVVLVTSLGKPEQKAAGMMAGANAYLVKSAFDQELLLDAIKQLL